MSQVDYVDYLNNIVLSILQLVIVYIVLCLFYVYFMFILCLFYVHVFYQIVSLRKHVYGYLWNICKGFKNLLNIFLNIDNVVYNVEKVKNNKKKKMSQVDYVDYLNNIVLSILQLVIVYIVLCLLYVQVLCLLYVQVLNKIVSLKKHVYLRYINREWDYGYLWNICKGVIVYIVLCLLYVQVLCLLYVQVLNKIVSLKKQVYGYLVNICKGVKNLLNIFLNIDKCLFYVQFFYQIVSLKKQVYGYLVNICKGVKNLLNIFLNIDTVVDNVCLYAGSETTEAVASAGITVAGGIAGGIVTALSSPAVIAGLVVLGLGVGAAYYTLRTSTPIPKHIYINDITDAIDLLDEAVVVADQLTNTLEATVFLEAYTMQTLLNAPVSVQVTLVAMVALFLHHYDILTIARYQWRS